MAKTAIAPIRSLLRLAKTLYLKKKMANIINKPKIVGQPENLEHSVWRYSDLAGFIALLKSGSLSFGRADKFLDKYEGTIPENIFRKYKEDGNLKYLKLIQNIRSNTFINCWNLNERESEAMWKLYCPDGKGVVIKSTYNKLIETIPTYLNQNYRVSIGLVKYRDYVNFDIDTDDFYNAGNFYKYFYSKRIAFEHEKEIRLYAPPSFVPTKPSESERLDVPVNTSELIHEVRVSPESGEWFRLLIEDVLSKYGINTTVAKSEMSKLPSLLNLEE